MLTLSKEAIEGLSGQTIIRVEGKVLHLSSGKSIYLDEEEVESLNEYYEPQPFPGFRKDDSLNPTGTSFHDHAVTTTVEKLKSLFGEPTNVENDGTDKVNYEWLIVDEEG